MTNQGGFTDNERDLLLREGLTWLEGFEEMFQEIHAEHFKPEEMTDGTYYPMMAAALGIVFEGVMEEIARRLGVALG